MWAGRPELSKLSELSELTDRNSRNSKKSCREFGQLAGLFEQISAGAARGEPPQPPPLIFGLEKQWSTNPELDRLSLNRLKQSNSLSIVLVTVSTRDGSLCKPSVVSSDY